MTGKQDAPPIGIAQLGMQLSVALDRAGASPGERLQLASLHELDSNWRPGPAPNVTYLRKYVHWPGRIAERAVDAGNHLRWGSAAADGLVERQRRYCFVVISLMLLCRTTAADLAAYHGFKFDWENMVATLRGDQWGQAETRRRYLRAALCMALDRRVVSPAQLVAWLNAWGAPVDSRDPVLYIDEKGVPHDTVTGPTQPVPRRPPGSRRSRGRRPVRAAPEVPGRGAGRAR